MEPNTPPIPRQWPYVAGILLGAVLGMGLALGEVTSGVVMNPDAAVGPRFRVWVLGFTVHRYPEDGDYYEMRPGAQVFNIRNHLAMTSTVIGAVVGGLLAHACCRLRRPRL